MNNRFCIVTRMYTIISGLSFIESLGKVANHKALGTFPSMKLSRILNALRVNSKSVVFFIEQERRIEVFLAFTDCKYVPWSPRVVYPRSSVWLLADYCLS